MKSIAFLIVSVSALALSGCCHTMNAAVMRTMCCKDKCCRQKCIGDRCPCGDCPSEKKVKVATMLLPI